MSDSFRLSQRAVAASAFALVLTGASFAPAVADDGDGKKGGKGAGQSGQAHGRGNGGKGSGGGSGSGGESRSDGAARGSGGAKAAQGGQGAQGGADNGDPAGNNGTFKVDGLAFDDGLGNEPHVGCGFRLKFYGFDEGQTGDITIAGHAPSGSGVVSQKNDVLISDDAAGGGPNDPDAIVTYTMDDLDLSGLTAHPKQGYHVKVTLSTDTPGGVKHKVFWIEPCAPEVAPTDTVVPGTDVGGVDTGIDTEVGGTDTSVGGVETGEEARVLGTRITRSNAPAAANRGGASVLGTNLARGPLAFTGSFTEALLALGGGLVAAGAGFVLWARKPRGKHAL
ncbi:MAG TPA: hypothetical protein VNQ77_05490 [Frankiaceae bacterium]|nr:hypothetical protein [Frankiaceae bacterium]